MDAQPPNNVNDGIADGQLALSRVIIPTTFRVLDPTSMRVADCRSCSHATKYICHAATMQPPLRFIYKSIGCIQTSVAMAGLTTLSFLHWARRESTTPVPGGHSSNSGPDGWHQQTQPFLRCDLCRQMRTMRADTVFHLPWQLGGSQTWIRM